MYPFFTCSQEVYKTNTWSFDTECVLLGGNNADAIYPLFYFKGKFDAYQRTYVIESKNNNNIRFFYYVLRKKLEDLRNQSTGATTKFLTLKILNNLQITTPNEFIQSQMVAVLSCYDDLIENNEKRIRILEEMAQRLYTEWFVKFKFPLARRSLSEGRGHEKVKMLESGTEYGMIPEGWKVVLMKDVAEIVDCLHSKKPERIRSGTHILLQLNNILENGLIDILDKYIISEDDYQKWIKNIELRKGDCVITNVGRIAATAQISGEIRLAAGRNMTAIRPKRIPDSFLIQYLKSPHIEREVKMKIDAGAIMGSLNVKSIYILKILLPDDSTLENFSVIASSWREEMNILHVQNSVLKRTRDLLIPQLVSGKRELKN